MTAESGNELLSYLGEPIEAPRVQQLLKELGVNEIPERKPGRTQINVLAEAHGLELTFQPASELRDGGSLIDSPERLVLSVIFFRADSSDKGSAYSGRLPNELQFANTRAQAHALLGAPSASSDRYKNDRWQFGSRSLTIDFAEDEHSIEQVTAWLPWKPRQARVSRPSSL